MRLRRVPHKLSAEASGSPALDCIYAHSVAERVDVVIVGAGAMGAATAWQLAKRGRSVVLIEQFELLHRWGSSHGQTRIFRFAYRDSRYTELAQYSLPFWRELESDSGALLLEQNGQLDHGAPAAVNDVVASLRAHQFAVEVLTPAAAHDRWPGMNFEGAVAFSPDGGRVFADRTVDAALTSAVHFGAELLDHTPVDRIEVRGDRALVHAGGRIWETECVVVAAGAWLPGLVGDLVQLPPLAITHQQPVHFAIRTGAVFPSFIHHQESGSELGFAAYGLESPDEGVKLGLEGTVRPVALANRRLDPDPAVTREAQAYAERWLPGADPTQVTAATCLFTETADGHFVIDRAGPIVICSPCSGHGFKFVPGIGALTADLATGIDHGRNYWRLPTPVSSAD